MRHLPLVGRVAGATALVVALVTGTWTYVALSGEQPETYAEIVEHFKYGSIGSEPGVSILQPVGGNLPPYWIFRALPSVCPEKFVGGYESFGLVVEPGRDRPIGFSRRRRIGLDHAGMNCALCHTGTVRDTPDSPPRIVPGMPAHSLDLYRLVSAMTSCTLDPRLTPAAVIATLPETGGPSTFERALLHVGFIDTLQNLTREFGSQTTSLFDGRVPPWGMGRVDTFNAYKGRQLKWDLTRLPLTELIAPTDLPSLWNQAPRAGMQLHWDGDNDNGDERNLSAAVGAGVTPRTVDHGGIKRVRDWTWTLRPPPYPYPIDDVLASRGQALYSRECLTCHGDHRFRDGVKVGSRIGTVEPVEAIGTDRHRLDSFTEPFMLELRTLYSDAEFRFTHFRKTDGYANIPLDGVWLRGPFLHNGSVPTIRDLLEPQPGRPRTFFRGYDVFDQVRVGFVSNVSQAGGRAFFRYDVSVAGNSNSGHEYGTTLSDEDKSAIVEYVKRF